jgi:hypothetical protein
MYHQASQKWNGSLWPVSSNLRATPFLTWYMYQQYQWKEVGHCDQYLQILEQLLFLTWYMYQQYQWKEVGHCDQYLQINKLCNSFCDLTTMYQQYPSLKWLICNSFSDLTYYVPAISLWKWSMSHHDWYLQIYVQLLFWLYIKYQQYQCAMQQIINRQ